VKRRLLAILTLAVVTFVGAATPALAAPANGGRDFGQRVSNMAPVCPQEHGAAFGACVSEMAKGGECSHMQ